MSYGLQLFSVRDLTEQNLDKALYEVASIGYHAVEFAGFFGHSAQEVVRMLEAYRLTVSGTHTGVSELEGDLDALIAYHQAIGNKNIIIPGAALGTQAEIDAFVALVQKVQPKLAEAGIALHYHNHDFEFKPNVDGVIPYEELIQKTDLLLEVDTFWVYAAGQDPIALLERLGDRVRLIHVKDGLQDGTGKPLGQGTAPVQAVLAYAAAKGLYQVVESETLTPDGITEAKVCFTYLMEQ